MLVVVVGKGTEGEEGKKGLLAADGEGSVGVYAYAVISKQGDGKVTVKKEDDPGPVGTLLGGSVAALIGLLGGPGASVVAWTAGAYARFGVQLERDPIGGDSPPDGGTLQTPNVNAVFARHHADRTKSARS